MKKTNMTEVRLADGRKITMKAEKNHTLPGLSTRNLIAGLMLGSTVLTVVMIALANI